MELIINHLGNVKFEALGRGHRVVSDQPATNGGADEGMTPPELLLASLGTCAGFYAAQYLKARSLPADGLQIKISAEKLTQPARLSGFRMEVILPGLEERHEAGLLRAVKSCLIHHTLEMAPTIETVLNTGVMAQV